MTRNMYRAEQKFREWLRNSEGVITHKGLAIDLSSISLKTFKIPMKNTSSNNNDLNIYSSC